jgi:hypothetical protein
MFSDRESGFTVEIIINALTLPYNPLFVVMDDIRIEARSQKKGMLLVGQFYSRILESIVLLVPWYNGARAALCIACFQHCEGTIRGKQLRLTDSIFLPA